MKLRIVILAVLAFSALCCNAPNQQPPVQPVNLLQNARQAVIDAQDRVADAQATVDALQTAVDALPPDDPLRAEFEKQLARARPVLADANLVLTVARIFADALAGPRPTTQPAAPAVSPPAAMTPAL
jgi:hypothetical protein